MQPDQDLLPRIWARTPASDRYSLGGVSAIPVKRNGQMRIVRLTDLTMAEVESLLAGAPVEEAPARKRSKAYAWNNPDGGTAA